MNFSEASCLMVGIVVGKASMAVYYRSIGIHQLLAHKGI